jgi:hypothetical protein
MDPRSAACGRGRKPQSRRTESPVPHRHQYVAGTWQRAPLARQPAPEVAGGRVGRNEGGAEWHTGHERFWQSTGCAKPSMTRNSQLDDDILAVRAVQDQGRT